jgi:hypothetical protein
MMGLGLQEASLCKLDNITRHQLFVSPLIPYTSHNSSASLVVSQVGSPEELIAYCRKFLLRESAEGSDAGLCVAQYDSIGAAVIKWGKEAKSIVLTMEDATRLAFENGIYLEGLTGEKCGIIGSLAAIGLRKEGNDGRLLWMENLRETQGTFTVAEIFERLKIDSIVDMDLKTISRDALVELGDWSRPVMIGNKITLILQKKETNEEHKILESPSADDNIKNHGEFYPAKAWESTTLKDKLLTDEKPFYTAAPKEYIKGISG